MQVGLRSAAILAMPACATLTCQSLLFGIVHVSRALPGRMPAKDSMTWLKTWVLSSSVLGAQLKVDELGYVRRKKAELLCHAKLTLVIAGQIAWLGPSSSGTIAGAEGKR